MENKVKVKETECGLNNGCDRNTWKGPFSYSCGNSLVPSLSIGLESPKPTRGKPGFRINLF